MYTNPFEATGSLTTGSRQISTLATPTLSRAQPVTAISPAMPVVLLIGVSKLPYGPEEFEGVVLIIGLIAIDKVAVAVPKLLVACTVNVAVPAVVGVPLIVPEGLSDSDAGSEPLARLQVMVPVPVAARVWE